MDETTENPVKTEQTKDRPRWHKLTMALCAIGLLASVAVALALISLTPDKMLQMTAIFASLSTAVVSISIAFIAGNVGEHGAAVVKSLLSRDKPQ